MTTENVASEYAWNLQAAVEEALQDAERDARRSLGLARRVTLKVEAHTDE